MINKPMFYHRLADALQYLEYSEGRFAIDGRVYGMGYLSKLYGKLTRWSAYFISLIEGAKFEPKNNKEKVAAVMVAYTYPEYRCQYAIENTIRHFDEMRGYNVKVSIRKML